MIIPGKEPQTLEEAKQMIDAMYKVFDKIGFQCQMKSGWDDPAMRRNIGKLVREGKDVCCNPVELTTTMLSSSEERDSSAPSVVSIGLAEDIFSSLEDDSDLWDWNNPIRKDCISKWSAIIESITRDLYLRGFQDAREMAAKVCEIIEEQEINERRQETARECQEAIRSIDPKREGGE